MSFDLGGEDGKPSFFRGGELPKLLVLVGVLVAGSLAILVQFQADRNPAPPPGVVTKPIVKPVEPDRSEEFLGVRDLTETSLYDNAPKKLLLERARSTPADDLDAQSHRDVLFTHLWDRPEQYRGVPVHLEGTALRVITYEVSSAISPKERLYEAWITTAESQRFPYCCLFEDLPSGFPIGSNVSEFVSFNGYFLKKMAYIAGDKPRGAPLLVGKLGWRPTAQGGLNGPAPRQGWTWMHYAIGAVSCYAGIRVIMLVQRFLHSGPRNVTKSRTIHVTAEPVPDMNSLLANVPDEDEFVQRGGG